MIRTPGALAPSIPMWSAEPSPLGRERLVALARELARTPELWQQLVADAQEDGQRWFRPLLAKEGFEAWLLGWPAGQGIELHDHGGSSGGLYVVEGHLVETFAVPGTGRLRRRRLAAGQAISFGPDHIHDVANAGRRPALSIHVYSPRLRSMTFYSHRRGRGLETLRTVPATGGDHRWP
jgi:predicted metal-dependent enzyme (double-stranded beta helix superfamily)